MDQYDIEDSLDSVLMMPAPVRHFVRSYTTCMKTYIAKKNALQRLIKQDGYKVLNSRLFHR